MCEMSAPQLMLLQYNLRTGKQKLQEVKQEMESLLVMIKNVCDNYEVFEEGKEKDNLASAKALLIDATDFYNSCTTSLIALG